MDFNDTPQEAAFRAEAKAWLEANAPEFELPAGDKLSDAEMAKRSRAWQRRLFDGGFAGILLPNALGGRGGTLSEAMIFAEEASYFRLPRGPFTGIGLTMALPAILRHGSAEQQGRFVSPTLRGEITWCQLFSEPGAGSDLAAMRTRAVRDGDHWVVNGQKVWSSWAHLTDWGILIARTDPSVPKHKGLTFFVVDMKTPGIEVRPIHQISGASEFNEVFLTDVRIPDECRIGAVGEGWACAMTVLTGERMGQGGEDPLGGIQGVLRYAAATPRGMSGTALDSPAVRLALAQAYAEEQAEGHLLARLKTMISRGENPGALASAIKLTYANRLQRTSALAMELRELAGVAHGPEEGETARIWGDFIWSAAMRIAGGADEVLRNQLAERVLGMPSEIRSDKDVPFDKL